MSTFLLTANTAMKKMMSTLSLVLILCMSLSIVASAASYVADDITYQNLNGQQLAIKVYTLLPEQDPNDLLEADFEHDGYMYSYSDMVKQEQTFNEETLHTEVVTVTTAKKNLEDILAEWEKTKKENEEKRKEEVKQRVLQQTGTMFTEFDAKVRDGILEKLEKENDLDTESDSVEELPEVEELEE